MFSFILLNTIPRSYVTYNTPSGPWHFSVTGSPSTVQGQGTEHGEGTWCPWTRGNISLLQTQGLTCLLRLQRVTFIAMQITDSTCSTGSHINKGLTEIQAALGVEWNSFFWQIVCCCHGYGTCCTSGLFPTPLDTFLLLMPGFPWIFFCSLHWALDLLVSVSRPLTCRSNWTCLHTACPILQHASKGLPLSLVLQTPLSFITF